jgi:hypothetical protein
LEATVATVETVGNRWFEVANRWSGTPTVGSPPSKTAILTVATVDFGLILAVWAVIHYIK